MTQIAHAVGYFVSWFWKWTFNIVFVPFFSVSNHFTPSFGPHLPETTVNTRHAIVVAARNGLR